MTSFGESLELFGAAWLTMLLAAIALSWPGILVVARGQVVLAIAAAQAAAFGAAAAMALIGALGNGHVHGDARIHLGALLGGLLGTAWGWRGGPERAGWIFAAGSAGSVLCVAYSPYGMHDVLALQHSNALSAGSLEAVVFAMAAVLLAVGVGLRHRELRLLAVDPDQARACGLSPGRWNLVLGGVLGLLLSLTVSSLGLLYTFACLILPTLIAARLVSRLWPLLLLAPAVALLGAVLGIVAGHRLDLPPGQTAAAALVLLLPLAGAIGFGLRRWRRAPVSARAVAGR